MAILCQNFGHLTFRVLKIFTGPAKQYQPDLFSNSNSAQNLAGLGASILSPNPFIFFLDMKKLEKMGLEI